ncbi:MAG: JAB domain-containing protein [Clostridia bacterium]
MGRVKVIQLKALLEISARIAASQARERFCAANPESVAALYMQQMRFLSKEVVKAVFLNGRNEIITAQDISLGTVNFSIISARDIFLAALKQEAVSLIMLHNHPSGDPRPSRSDIIATKRLRECGTLLEINCGITSSSAMENTFL